MDFGSNEFFDRRWKRHPYRLKNFSADALAFAADSKALSAFFDLYLLQRFEVLLDIGPLKTVLMSGKALIQFLAKNQGKKAAKHMTCDIRIILMKKPGGSP